MLQHASQHRVASALQDALQRLRDFVNGLGGVPDARIDLGIKGNAACGLERNWTFAEAQRSLMLQKQYLEFCVGGGALLILLFFFCDLLLWMSFAFFCRSYI